MNPGISVVMPVYNVAPWLRECLDSVREQTFTDWECICVDDGSTDGSAEILDEYAAQDARFRILRREHSNAGAVRNFGMAKATGDYMAFLDSDDVFSPWMFETLLDKAEETGADIVVCDSEWFRDGDAVPAFSALGSVSWEDRTPDPDWTKRPLDVGTMPWNKLIRHSFVDRTGIRFLEQSSTNDLTFMALALALSEKTESTKEPFVAYRQRARSVQTGKSRNPENFLRATDAFLERFRESGHWQALSPTGRKGVFEWFAGVAVWELGSQNSFAGYRKLRRLLIERANCRCWTEAVSSVDDSSPAVVQRFRDIVKGSRKEKIRAWMEAVLSPWLGNLERARGIDAVVGKGIRRIILNLFGAPYWPWNSSGKRSHIK